MKKEFKKKYKIEIEETLTRVIEVEARNQEEAYDIVFEQYREEEIVLTEADYEDTKFYVLNENNDRVCEV